MNWSTSFRNFRRNEVLVCDVFHNSVPAKKIKSITIQKKNMQNCDHDQNEKQQKKMKIWNVGKGE